MVDTYTGIAPDAKQAEKTDIKLARRDTIAAVDELVVDGKIEPGDVAESRMEAEVSEFYASEVVLISDVEFGL